MIVKASPQRQCMNWRIAAYGVVLLGFFLRIYQLNDVAVEKAEMMSIVWFIRRGLVFLLTHNKDLNNHPLNSLLAYLTSWGNESVFSLRWHSVVIGLITVAAILRLARDWFGERNGLVAGLLMSTSAYHVTLSQRSRGYVGMVGFTVLGVYFAWRAVQTGQKRYWLGFAVTSCLNIYSHLYGAVAVGVVGIIALVLLVRQMANRSSVKKSFFVALSPLVFSVAVAYSISIGLYLPMWSETISVAGQDNQFRQSDVRHAENYTVFDRLRNPVREAIRPFSLTKDSTRLRLHDPDLRYGLLDRLAAPAEGAVGFYLALGSFLLGLLLSWSRFRWQTIILVVWFGLPFVAAGVAGVVLPGAYFRGRFLAFIYPPYLLATVNGWLGLADWLIARVGQHHYSRIWAASVGWLGVGVLALLNLAWLGAFYSAAINEDWDVVAHHILQNRQPEDLIVCGQQPKTPCDFDLSIRTQTDVQEFDKLVFETFQGDRAYAEREGRVWLVMPHLTQRQISGLKEEVRATHYWLAGNPQYDQVGWVLMDSHQTLGDNLASALQLGATLSLDTEDRYRNLISLAEVRLTQSQVAAAEEAFALASELLPGDVGSDHMSTTVTEQLRYAREAARTVASLPPAAVQVNLTFGGVARLMAYEMDRHTILPGESFRLTLYWQPLARITRNLVSYVHLTDHGANLMAQVSGIPAGGQSPTTSWEPGQIIVDEYAVDVDAATQAPLVANIEVGLFDPQTYEFIKPIDDAGQPVSSAIAEAKVVPSASSFARPAYALNANFASLISLIGYDLTSDPSAIIFYWQAQAAMSEEYTVFVHLLNGDGQLVGQMDGPPVEGNYPTSRWSPGEVVADRHLVPAVEPGTYLVMLGWYRLADGYRLPLADGSGDSMTLGTIEVP